MNDLAVAYLRKARQSLAAARTLLETDALEDSASRAYYAAFHAATAALATAGETPHTHKGVHNRFRVRFVHSGLFPEHTADVLPFAVRRKAD